MTVTLQPNTVAHFSPEAEQQVVAALLDGAHGFSLIARNGGIGLFADPLHREIYRAVEKKANAGEMVTPITVKAAMEACPVMAQYGGPGYLARVAIGYLGPAALGGYVDLLSELARKRHLSAAISDAQSALSAGEETADRVAARLETAIIAAESSGGGQKPVGMLAAVAAAVEQARAAYHGETDDVVKSGIPALDRIVPGLYPGELTLIGGRPSMGKSAVALAIALNVAREGHGVAIASLEMTPEAMAARALSEATSHARNAVPYLRIVNAIHKHDQPVPDNDRVLAGMFRCSTRKARALLNALIEAGKVQIVDGKITNDRASSDLVRRGFISSSRAESGAKGGRTRAECQDKSLERNETHQAIASPRIEENREEKEEPIGSSKKRASRLSETWTLPKPWGDFALSQGMPEFNVRREAGRRRGRGARADGLGADLPDADQAEETQARGRGLARTVAGLSAGPRAPRPVARRQIGPAYHRLGRRSVGTAAYPA